jgi:hypothetical protein
MLDINGFDAALKVRYTNDRVVDMCYANNPLLALMPKDENMKGKNTPVTTVFAQPQGRSADFAQAKKRGRLTSSKLDDFVITRKKDYGICTIDNETMLASEGDGAALLDATELELDGIIGNLSNSAAKKMYGNGSGSFGRVGSISTDTITFLSRSDSLFVQVGMEIVGAQNPITGAIRALGSSGNGLFVKAVDRSAGTATFDYDVTDATNGIPTLVANDYLFVRGDRDEGSGGSAKNIMGLDGWLPYGGVASNDSFFGVNRSVDSRLYGLYLDGSGGPIEEVLEDAAAMVGENEGSLSHYFMPWDNWKGLVKSLGTKVQYIDVQVTPKVGFRGVEIVCGKQSVKVIPDKNCPAGKIYGLSLQYWKLGSIGKLPRPIDTDGLKMLRMSDDDGVECRYGYYGNMWCRAPGWNIVINY